MNVMTPWIENVSRTEIIQGSHKDPGINSMLIQISDPPGDHPIPKHVFRDIHRFDFLDIEADQSSEEHNLGDLVEFAITQQDADKLVQVLQHALINGMNVVVHCNAGVCRSGAVAEIGVMMGFRDTGSFRSPNLLVKHKMMKALGWDYDPYEQHTINGVPVPDDWTNDNEKVFILAHARKEHRERIQKQ